MNEIGHAIGLGHVYDKLLATYPVSMAGETPRDIMQWRQKRSRFPVLDLYEETRSIHVGQFGYAEDDSHQDKIIVIIAQIIEVSSPCLLAWSLYSYSGTMHSAHQIYEARITNVT